VKRLPISLSILLALALGLPAFAPAAPGAVPWEKSPVTD